MGLLGPANVAATRRRLAGRRSTTSRGRWLHPPGPNIDRPADCPGCPLVAHWLPLVGQGPGFLLLGRLHQTVRPAMSNARQFATASRRIAAYLVDLLLLGPPLAAVAATAFDRGERVRRGSAFALLVASGYHIAFEGTTGWTPGKRTLGVRVERADGAPCGYRAATTRTLARFVDFLPVAYLAAFAAMGLTERRQRLGDLLGGTVVVEGGDGA